MFAPTTTIIEHRRRTDAEGWATLKIVLLTGLGLTAFGVFFFGSIFRQEGLVMPTIWAAIVLLVFSIGIYYAIINIRTRDTFVCRMDGDVIECISPVSDCGDSFVIPLGDVARVEKEEYGDSYRWYIWNSAGERFWLTTNYDNPAEVFAEALRNLKPNVQNSET